MRIQAEFTAAERAIWMKMLIYPCKMKIYTIEENNSQKCDKHLHENESREKFETSLILYAPNYLQGSQKEIVINNNRMFSCCYLFISVDKTSVDFSGSSVSRM